MLRLPRLPWDVLDKWGLSLQVVKTAIAAGLSWGLAVWLFHSPKPYFAPLAAILCVQATIAEAISRGLQRIFGVMGGIVLAMIFTHVVGLHAWSLALLVLVAMASATRLHLGAQGIPQVAISALLVLAIGSEVKGYAWYRALDTGLGAAVAILVAAAIWPPNLTPDAREALRLLAIGLAEVVDGIQRDLADGLDPAEANRHLTRARGIDSALHRARTALDRAKMSLRWNPWHRHERGRLTQLAQAIEVLDHSVSQVRGIARTLFVTLERDVSRPSGTLPVEMARRLGRILSLMGEALKSYAYLIHQGDEVAAVRLENLLDQARVERNQLIAEAGRLVSVDPARFIDVAAVLVDLDKMREDLTISARLIIPIVVIAR